MAATSPAPAARAAGWRRAGSPAPGFASWRAAGRLLCLADDYADALADAGLFEPDGFERAHAVAGPAGRGRTALLSLADGRRVHVRPVRHGGWLGGLRGDALLGTARPLDELRVTASLRAAGAPVPRPVMVLASRSGPFWRASLATGLEADARDAAHWLAGSPDAGRIRDTAGAAGRAIRRLHDLGGSHRDLHVGNLLVRDDGDVVIADLDRARRLSQLPAALRMKQVMRLYRSLRKRGLDGCADDGAIDAFWAGYLQGDDALRDAMFARLRVERMRVALHALLYRAAPERAADRVEPDRVSSDGA